MVRLRMGQALQAFESIKIAKFVILKMYCNTEIKENILPFATA